VDRDLGEAWFRRSSGLRVMDERGGVKDEKIGTKGKRDKGQGKNKSGSFAPLKERFVQDDKHFTLMNGHGKYNEDGYFRTSFLKEE
jgi:hypothetical protein